METWMKEFKAKVVEVCDEGVENWVKLIDTLGVPDQIRSEWCCTYLKLLRNTMVEMYKDVEERQKTMQKTVSSLKNKVAEITFAMGINRPVALPNEPNLYQEEAKLKSYIQDLEDQLQRKKDDVHLLLKRQEKICNTLGKPQKLLSDIPLPSAEEMEQLLLHIEALEDECFSREEKYAASQVELQKLADEIDYEPLNDFEAKILKPSNIAFEVSDKNMIMLNALHQSLEQHASNIRTEVGIFISHISQLWVTLDTDEAYCNNFLKNHSGCKKQTINELKNEIKRLEDLKKANIEMLVKRMREQVVVQWDKCHYSEAQRQQFAIFDDDMYTESMLTEYQNEVQKLMKFYEDNKVLFESIAKYEETWRRVDELETPEQGQNRFRNRGGKLLIEEKERKVAKKRLEKLDNSIMKMADDFFKANGEEFLYEGLTIDDYFKTFQKEFKDQKLSKSPSSLGSSKSSNLIDRCKSVPKMLKSLPQPPPSPIRRRGFGRTEENTTLRSQKSNLSDLTKSAPVNGNSLICSRKRRMKNADAIHNLKNKTAHIRNAIQLNDGALFTEIQNFSRFQRIADTTMPSLLDDSLIDI